MNETIIGRYKIVEYPHRLSGKVYKIENLDFAIATCETENAAMRWARIIENEICLALRDKNKHIAELEADNTQLKELANNAHTTQL